MDYFTSIPLTSAGRPVLLEEEVEVKVVDNVETVLIHPNGHLEHLFPPAVLILTNLRLLLVLSQSQQPPPPPPPPPPAPPAPPSSYGILLQTIQSIENNSGLFKRSTRVKVNFHHRKTMKDLTFRFIGGEKDDFLLQIERALTRKSWEKILPPTPTPTPPAADTSTIPGGSGVTTLTTTTTSTTSSTTVSDEVGKGFSVRNAGVSGIIRKQEKSLESVDQLTKSALSDLDALMNRAREVISVVQRYAAYVTAEKEGEEEEGMNSETASSLTTETNEMENILQSIGIISPITKSTAGRQYHNQLARQIADLLLIDHRLERLGGLVTLPDLYCLINRARGTSLVSPDDLLAASKRMERLQLGMHLRIFNSGVKVIQLDSFSDQAAAQRLADRLLSIESYRMKGATAMDIAQLLGVSVVVAKEVVRRAEEVQLIVRDDGPQGLYYYPNLFPQFLASSGLL
eukprot:scaffold7537_cov179-Ochromonas_danica.AAC.24